ncbi:MAG: hypothetical protein K2W95_33485 [Candidatus Obscuribacterales bacterium]|nr:hypothetical protein [Candidatus Obscuribacterales bacterium]
MEKGVGAALQEFALLFIDLLIETEVQEKSGKRYQHDEEREVTRWGKQKGAVYAKGQKLPILRQRLRSKAGEVELESYKALNDKTLLNEENIATRNVKRWRTEEQMERWLATGLLEAEKKLKKIPGYTQLPALRHAIAKQIEKKYFHSQIETPEAT